MQKMLTIEEKAAKYDHYRSVKRQHDKKRYAKEKAKRQEEKQRRFQEIVKKHG